MKMNWQDLIMPKGLEDDAENTPTYGKFVCEPLERGYGITLGNALRRVILSSLQGAAITAVRIDWFLSAWFVLNCDALEGAGSCTCCLWHARLGAL